MSEQCAVQTAPESLRDRFAMAALTGFMMNHAMKFRPEDDAEYCYKIADAMLKAREVQP